MTYMVWVAVAVTCLSFGYLCWAALGGASLSKRRVQSNLARGLPEAPRQKRAVPAVRLPAQVGLSLTPKLEAAMLERLLAQAGRPAAWPLERVLSVKLLLTAGALVIATLLLTANGTPTSALVGVALVLLGYFGPDLRLYSMGIERREAVTLQLADMLDQMSIAVEAGLGFDAAMVHVARNGKGVLAEELKRTMQDIQVGQSRRAALEDLSARANVPDLRQFVRSVIQAESYGLALSTVLHTQAAEMRLKRRQRAEERAMKIPVKVVFPLTVCILPVLFIVILGPAAIQLIMTMNS